MGTNDDKTTDRASLQIQMTPDLKARIQAAADERGIGIGMLGERMLEHGLTQLRPVGDLFISSADLGMESLEPIIPGHPEFNEDGD